MPRIEDFPEHVQRQIRAKIAGGVPRRPPIPAANVEPNPCDATPPPASPKVTDKAVVLRIHSRRKRLADIDGICAKWAIDSLVSCGLLQDDSAEFVKAVEFSQEQGEPEQTIIEIVVDRGADV